MGADGCAAEQLATDVKVVCSGWEPGCGAGDDREFNYVAKEVGQAEGSLLLRAYVQSAAEVVNITYKTGALESVLRVRVCNAEEACSERQDLTVKTCAPVSPEAREQIYATTSVDIDECLEEEVCRSKSLAGESG